MNFAARTTATLTIGLTSICLIGCPGVLPDGMADLTTPAPCTVDSDCPDGIACVFQEGTDQDGFCDVDETQVSTGTPAPCNTDEDCPDGIACILSSGKDQDGFCDVEEMLAP